MVLRGGQKPGNTSKLLHRNWFRIKKAAVLPAGLLIAALSCNEPPAKVEIPAGVEVKQKSTEELVMELQSRPENEYELSESEAETLLKALDHKDGSIRAAAAYAFAIWHTDSLYMEDMWKPWEKGDASIRKAMFKAFVDLEATSYIATAIERGYPMEESIMDLLIEKVSKGDVHAARALYGASKNGYGIGAAVPVMIQAMEKHWESRFLIHDAFEQMAKNAERTDLVVPALVKAIKRGAADDSYRSEAVDSLDLLMRFSENGVDIESTVPLLKKIVNSEIQLYWWPHNLARGALASYYSRKGDKKNLRRMLRKHTCKEVIRVYSNASESIRDKNYAKVLEKRLERSRKARRISDMLNRKEEYEAGKALTLHYMGTGEWEKIEQIYVKFISIRSGINSTLWNALEQGKDISPMVPFLEKNLSDSGGFETRLLTSYYVSKEDLCGIKTLLDWEVPYYMKMEDEKRSVRLSTALELMFMPSKGKDIGFVVPLLAQYFDEPVLKEYLAKAVANHYIYNGEKKKLQELLDNPEIKGPVQEAIDRRKELDQIAMRARSGRL